MDARATLTEAAARVGLRVARWRKDPLAILLSGGAIDDPYPLYDRMRRGGLSASMLGVQACADYATATEILRDGRFSSSPAHERGFQSPHYPPGDPRSDLLGPETSLLTMDPPDHTRIRRLVASAFTRRATDALEPFIRKTASSLLDEIDVRAGFDLVESFALPLPIAVICRLLGVPVGDQETFWTWGHDVALSLEPQITGAPNWRLVDSERALTEYLRALIAARRGEPDDTVLSALIAAEEHGEHLHETELVATALVLLVAGFETTVNLIANGTAALLDAPDVWARLREEPSRWPDAVDELLRVDSPVQMTSRIATCDVEVAGTTLRRGTSVVVAIGGANRDPRVFEEPARIDIDRRDRARHVSFSLGIHHCLGAALARLEARVGFEALSARVARPVRAGRSVRRATLALRGYDSLPIRDEDAHSRRPARTGAR